MIIARFFSGSTLVYETCYFAPTACVDSIKVHIYINNLHISICVSRQKMIEKNVGIHPVSIR